MFLQVYRDSETTPMVCCDVCERWVHCLCDGIRNISKVHTGNNRYSMAPTTHPSLATYEFNSLHPCIMSLILSFFPPSHRTVMKNISSSKQIKTYNIDVLHAVAIATRCHLLFARMLDIFFT
ncbi:hypothetical protein BHE74_00006431 [Ensete ventricosum]|nr:hypothetical protein GW17_00001225 [Ensete ventricosum]RWW84934.1 hypothetical protein BHE74_00006431 [Ensete ventricosum]